MSFESKNTGIFSNVGHQIAALLCEGIPERKRESMASLFRILVRFRKTKQQKEKEKDFFKLELRISGRLIFSNCIRWGVSKENR